MRRLVAVTLAGLALLVSMGAAPVHARTTARVPFVGPARSYQLDGGVVCPFTVSAQERSGHPGTLTLNDKGEVVGVQFHGSYDTLLSSSHGDLTFESWGVTTITANRDGTWTMLQVGSGIAVVPPSDPAGPKLVWFTGAVISVGDFDAKNLSFVPRSQIRVGSDSNICNMLVTGIKTRHDNI